MLETSTDYFATNYEKIEIQIQKLGGEVHFWSTPSRENNDILICNTGIAKICNNKYLVAQRQIYNRNGNLTINWRENPSQIILSYLNLDNYQLQFCNFISLLNEFSIEDPRLSVSENGVELWVSKWKFNKDKCTTDQSIIELDDSLNIKRIYSPPIGFNNKVGHEKNWLPILATDYFVYNINHIHTVFNRHTLTKFETEGISWNYGIIHGGTPCIDIGNGHYLSFFQSSLPLVMSNYHGISINQRYYFIGAYLFSKIVPFKILKYSNKPILYSSFKNEFITNSPCCLFPLGLTILNSSIILTFGINDCSSASAVLPLESVLDKLIEL